MDILTPNARSERMRLIGNKNTKPEMIVRKLLYSMKFRYRNHARYLPGSPDIVFKGRRKVIFVHGCFWHGHISLACKKGRYPASRQDFWIPKLDGNKKRDMFVRGLLEQAGWDVLIVWECECRRIEELRATLYAFLTGSSASKIRVHNP